jgi:hypothetical protein
MLVERDVLSQEQLLDALRTHYMELLGHLLSWRQGDFKFYGNDEVSFEEGLAPISVQDILLSQISAEDEAPPARKKPPPAKPPPKAVESTGVLPEIPDLLTDSLPSLGPTGPREVAAEPPRKPPSRPPVPVTPGAMDPILPAPSAPREEPGPPELQVVYRRLPSSRPIKVRTTGGGGFDEGFIILSLGEQRLLQQVDGERALAMICREVDLGAQAGQAAAERLKELRLIRSVDEEFSGTGLPEAEIGGPMGHAEESAESTRAPADLSGAFAWASRGFGILAVVVLLWTVLVHAQVVLLPFPWQEGQRKALEKQQRTAAFLKVDRAVKTFVLMMGRFPESLPELADLHLLSHDDERTPGGLPLTYQASDLQYSVTPVRDGQPLVEQTAAEAITGNFLLDYDFFSVAQGAADQPLILLD